MARSCRDARSAGLLVKENTYFAPRLNSKASDRSVSEFLPDKVADRRHSTYYYYSTS